MTRPAALITGAGRRIGAFLAEHLAQRAYQVFVHVHASRQEGEAVVAKINASGGTATLVAADLGRRDQIAAMMATILAAPDELAVIINNASYFAYDVVGAADDALLERSLDAHIRGPYAIYEFVAREIPDRRLTFFNVLDQKLNNFNPDYYSYTIGKAGLSAMSRMWQVAAPQKFRAFGILPGLVLTSGAQSAEDYERAKASNPLRRAVTPQDIADAIDFFLDNPELPGQDIGIDCGESLMPRPRDVAFDPSLHQA